MTNMSIEQLFGDFRSILQHKELNKEQRTQIAGLIHTMLDANPQTYHQVWLPYLHHSTHGLTTKARLAPLLTLLQSRGPLIVTYASHGYERPVEFHYHFKNGVQLHERHHKLCQDIINPLAPDCYSDERGDFKTTGYLRGIGKLWLNDQGQANLSKFDATWALYNGEVDYSNVPDEVIENGSVEKFLESMMSFGTVELYDVTTVLVLGRESWNTQLNPLLKRQV